MLLDAGRTVWLLLACASAVCIAGDTTPVGRTLTDTELAYIVAGCTCTFEGSGGKCMVLSDAERKCDEAKDSVRCDHCETAGYLETCETCGGVKEFDLLTSESCGWQCIGTCSYSYIKGWYCDWALWREWHCVSKVLIGPGC